MLLVTHRPEGLDLVDEIVRLEEGRVVERTLRRELPGVDESVTPPPARPRPPARTTAKALLR